MGNVIDMIAIHKQKRWHKKEEKRFEERFAKSQIHSDVVKDKKEKVMKEKLDSEDKKRERIKLDYQRQIQKIDDKIGKMSSKIHNSEEYKNLNSKRLDFSR